MYFHYAEIGSNGVIWEYIIDRNLASRLGPIPTVFWLKMGDRSIWRNNKINAQNWDWINRKHLPLKRILTKEELFIEIL